MNEKQLKAYKITQHDYNGFGIYIAESAGKAKTQYMYSLWDVYPEADYSWLKSCRRAPEYDYLWTIAPGRGCVAWSDGNENWQEDKGHWYNTAPCLMDTVI